MNTRTHTRRWAALGALATSSLWLAAGAATGQNALGDGRALDSSLQVGSGGFNGPTVGLRRGVRDELRLRNSIVTGNAAGGASFRGFVGYSATEDFRGELGSNDLFQFNRDAFYSGLATRGVRGIEALQQQMALATGMAPSPQSAGLIVERSGAGTMSRDLRPDASMAVIDPLTYKPNTLRSTSQFLTTRAAEPTFLTMREEQDGMQYAVKASALRGVVAEPWDPEADEAEELALTSPFRDEVTRDGGRISDPAVPSPESNRIESQRVTYDDIVAELARAMRGIRDEPADAEATDIDTTPSSPIQTPPQPEEDEFLTPAASPEDEEESFEDTPAPLQSFQQRLQSLRADLFAQNSLVVDQNPADTASDELAERAEDLLGRVRPQVEQFIDENEPTEASYDRRLARGQKFLREGRWFDAEEEFTRALSNRVGDPIAAIGRVHAELGAAMFLSADMNLRGLFTAHPEMIGVRYDAELLPHGDRLTEVIEFLRVESEERTDVFGATTGLMLAYLGYQTGSDEDILAGFAAIDRIDERLERETDALVTVLRAVWSPN